MSNHLEDLVAEWYELNGYFVRRNVRVGKRAKGGYDGELDIVAFNPAEKKLVHIEPSLDTDSWAKREERFGKKFKAGQKYIPKLFKGSDVPSKVDQIALLVYGGKTKKEIGGGRILFIPELLHEITTELSKRKLAKQAISEQYPLLRTIQFITEYKDLLFKPSFL